VQGAQCDECFTFSQAAFSSLYELEPQEPEAHEDKSK
jgi:hypothetical protein